MTVVSAGGARCPYMAREPSWMDEVVSTPGPFSKRKSPVFDSGLFCSHHPGRCHRMAALRLLAPLTRVKARPGPGGLARSSSHLVG